ncbi:MAG TPA: PIN domain-containing protein [Candidatus Limnocylindria bacterium]|nr:PIN domain-containing protein [Candidatus Limnocylindria bacterium]
MSVFVDTSALYALLDEGDARHGDASDALRRLVGIELVTHSYVVVEACALVGRRLPWESSVRLVDGILPVIDVRPVDADLYATAMTAYRRSGSSAVSLVDHASFAFIRSLGIARAFAYDDDFVREGIHLVA